MRFAAVPFPNADLMAAVEQLPPYSPFNTAAYAAAQSALGEQPYILTLDEGGAGCLAFLRRGRFATSLTVPSLPRLADPDPFFDGLRAFCRERSVWDVVLTTFGSDWRGAIPAVGTERSRRRRWEFLVPLSPGGLDLSSGHRRNAAKAERAGVELRRTREASAAADHSSAFRASMERRSARGEHVDMAGSVREAAALLESGAAEVFQAIHGGAVVSSLLVLRSARVAYYHSAGTTPDGMAAGASPFVVAGAARVLARDGMLEFNLGGAEPSNPGLYRFKEGFGATIRELEAATFSLAAPWWRGARAAWRWIAGARD
jgi:hypothetical protein